MAEQDQPETRHRILIVDDDPGTVQLLRSWFEDRRYEILEAGNGAFGFQNFMYQVAANPSLVRHFFERLTETYLRRLEKFLPAVEGLVDIISVGDDLGSQNGPLLSPPMYRQLIKKPLLIGLTNLMLRRLSSRTLILNLR